MREAPIVGYIYLGLTSSGPALARDPADLPAMVVTAIARQQSAVRLAPDPGLARANEQYWAIAGTNEVMLRWLLQCGWQIVFQYLFMSSRPLGMLDRYICHNPLYVL